MKGAGGKAAIAEDESCSAPEKNEQHNKHKEKLEEKGEYDQPIQPDGTEALMG